MSQTQRLEIYDNQDYQNYMLFTYSIVQRAFSYMCDLIIHGNDSAIQGIQALIENYLLIGGSIFVIGFFLAFSYVNHSIDREVRLTQMLIIWIPTEQFSEQIVQATMKLLITR